MGTRLRINAPGSAVGSLVGTLAAYEADSLTLTRGKAHRPSTLRLDDIASIDRSGGRNHVLGAVIGAAGGGLTGVILGVVCTSVCGDKHNGDANLAPIGGFVVGLPTGALVGALFGVERWQRVRFR